MALLDGEVEVLTRKAIDMALQGDTTALRLVLERVLPHRKDGPIEFALPPLSSAADAVAAMAGILGAVAAGDLTPAEGNAVAGLVEQYRRTLETADFEARLAAFEGYDARD